jgi:hypothetical protein
MKTTLAALVLVGLQDPKGELDLSWKLPHGQAAVYDVYDAAKGAKLGEFTLLGCELEKGPGSNGGPDLPARVLFRKLPDKVKIGQPWTWKDGVFDESPGNLSPLQASAAFRVKQVKKVRVEEVFKTAAKKGEKSEPVEAALVEGGVDFFRQQWTERKLQAVDKARPSLSLAATILVRSGDNAILGVRYTWKGRTEQMSKMMGDAVPDKADEARELVLREPFLEIGVKELKSKVDLAVDRGAKWLKAQMQADGSIADRHGYPIATTGGAGSTGLALLALLHSGVTADDPGVSKAFAWLGSRRLNQSYDLALRILAVEAKYLPLAMFEDVEKFSEEKARAEIAGKITKEDKALVEETVRLLLECQGKHGSFGYTKGIDEPNLSSIQYCLLALKAAVRMGAAVSPAVWKQALKAIDQTALLAGNQVEVEIVRFGGAGEKKESFPRGFPYYVPKGEAAIDVPTSTMVTAGITSLALIRSELARTNEWDDRSKKNAEDLEWGALAWLQSKYGLRASRPEGLWWGPSMTYYFLYSLERALIVAGVQTLGGHDWHHEGSALLLSQQKADGRWEGAQTTPVIDTAFALLFLKRATIPVETGDRPKKE